MPTYEVFAKYYDPIMGDSAETASQITSLIHKHNINAKTVLELAVGTGSVLKWLAGSYEVAGLDISPAMLEKARSKLPNTTFYEADMSNFKTGKSFDVIYCVFDSINHMDFFSEWESMFSAVHGQLNKGGLFIFDMNTIGRLRRLAYSQGFEQPFNGGKLVMEVSPHKKTTYTWHVRIYDESNGKWQGEDINESAFPLEQVRSALEKDFHILTTFGDGDEEPDDESDRVFFVCQKLETHKPGYLC